MTVAIPLQTSRPGLSFQYGYDWLAQRLHSTDGPAACLASVQAHKSEMYSRIPSLPFLSQQKLNLAASKIELPAIGWVMPQNSPTLSLKTLRPWIKPGGHLHILAAGSLALFLHEQREDKRPYLSASRILQTSPLWGWKVQEWIGLHGINGIFWHTMATAAGFLGKRDWQDRCHFGMRRSYVEHGIVRPLTALSCITLERIR